ncbi:MAG: GTPase-associated protein 1-related protein, partial [Actinomycetota bacterium]
ADPELWSVGADAWLPGPLPEEIRVWLAEQMETCLAGIGDVRGAAVALALIASLDIRPSDEALRRLGIEVLGPAVLTGPDESIERARATPAGARAWEGALDFLDRMGRLGDLGILVDRLREPRSRWVEDLDPQRFPRLAAAALIARARSHPGRRLEVLDRLLPAREAEATAAGPGVDELVSLLWAGTLPSAEEGVGLLQVLPHDLGGTSVPHLLMSCIAAAPCIDGHAVRLATSLAEHPCSDSLTSEHRALLDTLRHGDLFWRGRPDQPATELATRLFAGADGLPEPVHRWLIRGLCRWLISVAPMSHAEVLRPLWPPRGRATQQTYPTEMVGLLADRKACGPREVAGAFVAWEHLDRGRGDRGAPLLQSRLPQALRTWSRDQLDEVALALIPIDASWVPVWSKWRDKYLPTSVLGRLRRRLEADNRHRRHRS